MPAMFSFSLGGVAPLRPRMWLGRIEMVASAAEPWDRKSRRELRFTVNFISKTFSRFVRRSTDLLSGISGAHGAIRERGTKEEPLTLSVTFKTRIFCNFL